MLQSNICTNKGFRANFNPTCIHMCVCMYVCVDR